MNVTEQRNDNQLDQRINWELGINWAIHLGNRWEHLGSTGPGSGNQSINWELTNPGTGLAIQLNSINVIRLGIQSNLHVNATSNDQRTNERTNNNNERTNNERTNELERVRERERERQLQSNAERVRVCRKTCERELGNGNELGGNCKSGNQLGNPT